VLSCPIRNRPRFRRDARAGDDSPGGPHLCCDRSDCSALRAEPERSRSVVNFSRFDGRYHSLEKRREEQLAYFNEQFDAIAAENDVDPDELRAFLVENIDANSLGVDVQRLRRS
jgi:hypothetical protein